MSKNSRGIFITATGTDVGKTFISALIVKRLHEAGYTAGYYKAALSGAIATPAGLIPGDAHYVREQSQIKQPLESMVSYIYEPAVSPHLAAKLANAPLELSKVHEDFKKVQATHDFVTVEGSGGIICPLRFDYKKIFLVDVIQSLNIPTLIVADAGLGTINSTALTVEYLCNRNISVKGIILNNYTQDNTMHMDNKYMIESITGIKVIDTIAPHATALTISAKDLSALYG